MNAALSRCLALALLSGCASLPQQPVSVSFETAWQGAEISGAQCVVSNDVMQQKMTTPATLVLPAQGQLRVVCDKPGYLHAEWLQPAAFPDSSASTGTVSIGVGGGGGHVGLGLGLLLPLAASKPAISYPKRVVVEMRLQQPN
ncbi:MAG: hypothetical protein RL748_3571 [Pseudomonadota bacterium]|jgi:hypothetical protein